MRVPASGLVSFRTENVQLCPWAAPPLSLHTDAQVRLLTSPNFLGSRKASTSTSMFDIGACFDILEPFLASFQGLQPDSKRSQYSDSL